MEITNTDIITYNEGYSVLNIPCIVLNSKFHIKHINSTAKDLLGWKEESNFLNKEISDVWTMSKLAPIFDQNHKFLENIIVSINEKFLEWKLITIKQNSDDWYFLIAKDVTDHERTKRVLKKNYREVTGHEAQSDLSLTEYSDELRNYLETIIAQMPCYVYWKDLQFRYIGCNEMFLKEIIKVDSMSEFIGKTDYEFGWDEKIVDTYREVDEEIIRTGKPNLGIDEIFRHHDGTMAYFRGNKMPIFNKYNKIIGLVGIALNITEQKLAAEREKQAIAEKAKVEKDKEILKKQVESLDLVANSMAHDLRTPLGSIKRFAKNLKYFDVKLPGNENTEFHGTIQDIVNNVSRLNLFIDLMLSNSKNIEETPLYEVELYPVLEAVIEEYPYDEPKKRNLINFEKVNNFSFLGHEVYFKHIIANLIRNSLFFIEKSGKGTISLWTHEDEEYNYLHYKDTAEGVESEELNQIFSQYYTKTGVGTGIGLAFCKRVMKVFGGDIICNSVKGEFIEFIMNFPKLIK